jgi:hypothetical protein
VQAQAVKVATGNLTESQKNTIRRRQEKISTHQERSPSSRGEGTSKLKGKGTDPREWGGANLSQDSEDLDIEAQAAALNSIAQKNETSKHRREKHTPKPKIYYRGH